MTAHLPLPEMARIDYPRIRVPSADGSVFATAPAVPIRIWPLGAPLPDPRARSLVAAAVLDTGATVSSIPLRALHKMGITPHEESKRTVFGSGGDFAAYSVRVRMEIDYDGEWEDIGEIDVLVPDTVRSRDRNFHLPFLLGRHGFFSKFDMCVSESRKSAWLGRIDSGEAGSNER